MLHKVSELESAFGFNNTDSDALHALRDKELECYVASLGENAVRELMHGLTAEEVTVREFVTAARENMKYTTDEFEVSSELSEAGSIFISIQDWKR